MIRGIGTDIIQVSRIASAIERQGEAFLTRVFTQKEIAYCRSFNSSANQHFAGRWAAKEAVMKALGTGFDKSASWQLIEITNNEKGSPLVSLSDPLYVDLRLMISISHCLEYATAFCVILE